jgi:hypothetical protein
VLTKFLSGFPVVELKKRSRPPTSPLTLYPYKLHPLVVLALAFNISPAPTPQIHRSFIVPHLSTHTPPHIPFPAPASIQTIHLSQS